MVSLFFFLVKWIWLDREKECGRGTRIGSSGPGRVKGDGRRHHLNSCRGREVRRKAAIEVTCHRQQLKKLKKIGGDNSGRGIVPAPRFTSFGHRFVTLFLNHEPRQRSRGHREVNPDHLSLRTKLIGKICHQ